MIAYRVAKRPDNWWGMLLSLLLGRAGDGVLIGQEWYHFRRGRLVKDPAEVLWRKPGYIVAPIREATEAEVRRLNAALGTKWTVFNNCLKISPRIMP